MVVWHFRSLALQIVGILLQQDFLELGPSHWVGSASKVVVIPQCLVTMTWKSGVEENVENEWRSHWWSCCICSRYTAMGKNKCRSCGAKKAWATWSKAGQGAGYASVVYGNPPQQPTSSVPMTAYLPASEYWPSIDATTIPKAGSAADEMATSKDKEESPQQVIKSLESSLTFLPIGAAFEPTRAFIKVQIEDAKKLITKSKPLPSQLAACSAALERTKGRCEKAREAAQKAQDLYLEECKQVQHLESEFRRLESEITAASVPSPAASSIEEMSSALKRVLADMQ